MVSKKIFQGLTIIIFLFLANIANCEEYDHYEYWFFTGNNIITAWNPANGAIQYEAELYHMEQKVPVALGRTSATQIEFVCPRSGHYYFRVRAIGETENSDWSESTDPSVSTVNGEPRSWVIYNHIAPPTGSEID